MLLTGSHFNTKAISIPDHLTQEDWYVFGVYTADGYNAGTGVSLELQEGDYDWQKAIAVYITGVYGVDASWSQKTLNGRTYYRVRHHSQLLARYFAEHGVIPNKTSEAQLPDIPSAHVKSFLLGYSDGNGSICARVRSRKGRHGLCQHYDLTYEIYAGSHALLLGIQTAINALGIFPGNLKRRNDQNVSRLSWSAKNAESLLSWLYTDVTYLLLERKYARWLGWLSKEPIVRTNTLRWTEEQKQFVRDNRYTLSVEQIAQALSRTKNAIRKRFWVEDTQTKC